MELAIDTSNNSASIALSQQGEAQAEFTWLSEQNHTVELVPNIRHLLQQTGVRLDDLDAVIVARGPGSFNGLRVGVATAKGLSYALGIPLVGIGTFEVEAFPHRLAGLPVCAVASAGRGEVGAAMYEPREGELVPLFTEHITTIEKLCSRIVSPTIFCGHLPPDTVHQLVRSLGDKAVVSHGLRRAGYLAELGWRRLGRDESDDPATLQPIYLRPPSVTKPKRRTIKR